MEHNDNESETELPGVKPDRGPHSLPQITQGGFYNLKLPSSL